MIAYHWRMFERGQDGRLRTLFHSVSNRSRVVPVGEWIEAKQRKVIDGTGQQRYVAGFHVYRGQPVGLSAFRNRLDRLVLVLVQVQQTRPKPTNEDVLLARKMRVPRGAVTVPLEQYMRTGELVA